jgi:hypothetical protein
VAQVECTQNFNGDGKYRQWEVVLQKSGDVPLGVDVTTFDDALVVNGVRDGLVMRYNKCSPLEKQVQCGDAVVAVNNTTGDGETLFTLAAETGDVLRLLIRRVLEVRVNLIKTRRLGIGIALDENRLVVMEVAEDGLVNQYNQDAPAGSQVLPGDFIVDVNGTRGSAMELQNALAESGDELSFMIERT